MVHFCIVKREQIVINNSRKYVKFGTDLVDSVLNILWALELIVTFLGYSLPHENINVASEEQILYNNVCMKQLQNMLSEAQSGINLICAKCHVFSNYYGSFVYQKRQV